MHDILCIQAQLIPNLCSGMYHESNIHSYLLLLLFAVPDRCIYDLCGLILAFEVRTAVLRHYGCPVMRHFEKIKITIALRTYIR